MKTRDIRFGHLGNGIICYDRNSQERGDYKRIAHIKRDRTISFRTELSHQDRLIIEAFACFEHPNISATQSQKVFVTKPIPKFDNQKYKIALERYNSGLKFTGMTLDGEEITDGYDTYIEAASELCRETMKEPIHSNRPSWDKKNNSSCLIRYVTCSNESCSNETSSQDYDEARHKIEGYSFNPKSNSFNCEHCENVANSKCEYNEDSEQYKLLQDYTIIMSAYDGNERYEDIYFVEATTPRNAYAAAIRRFKRDMNARGYISQIHIATYLGHLQPLKEGEFAYRK